MTASAKLTTGNVASGRIEYALSRLVRWSLRQDVQHLILQRAGITITLANAWTLSRVVAIGPVRLSGLARSLGIDASTLTPRVRQLVADGLLDRRKDPQDRRVGIVAVTPAGHRSFDAIRAARGSLFDEALTGLSADEEQVLGHALSRIAEHLDQFPLPAPSA